MQNQLRKVLFEFTFPTTTIIILYILCFKNDCHSNKVSLKTSANLWFTSN